MSSYGFTENDWKLYRSKIGSWQEKYMERLCREYIEMLRSDTAPSERFWSLRNRIKEDRKSPGVMVRIARSEMIHNIMCLLFDSVITLDDLDGFSDDLKEHIVFIMKNHL